MTWADTMPELTASHVKTLDRFTTAAKYSGDPIRAINAREFIEVLRVVKAIVDGTYRCPTCAAPEETE